MNLTPEQIQAWLNSQNALYSQDASQGNQITGIDPRKLNGFAQSVDPTHYQMWDSQGVDQGVQQRTPDNFMDKYGGALTLAAIGGMTGAGLFGGGGASVAAESGSSLVGNGMGAFAPEAGSSGLAGLQEAMIANGGIESAGGSQLVGNGLGAFAPAEAAGSNLVGNGMGAFAPGTAVSTVGGGGLLNSLSAAVPAFGGSDLLKGAGLLAGAVAGSKPTTTSNTTRSKTDPRLDPYIYGDQGILAQAQQWQQANKTGLNPQMTRGLNTLTDVYTNPANKQGYQSMQNLGLGLMSSPIAGNPYTRK